ncbi:DUF421 domain-containing protein [Metabacillus litoralis]|uniref:DUF421 domain-containing protein n=1 Tax=Metabacillus litoralis TaxID=152268 RepID=UPI001CFDBDE6|nr:DUF421 domain-containing protein [Metabacillus litoralis]
MEDMLKDILIVFGRIITILPLLLFITIFMGKRAIGELPIFDFLIIITLGAVVGADIADPSIHHIPTAFTIVVVGLFQRVVANWKISNRKVGKLLTFEPTIVVQDGVLLNENIKSIRYSIDNILQMLREKNVFDINDVETAIIEANGSCSVLKKKQKQFVTIEDMGVERSITAISFPVIMDGEIFPNVLQYFDLDDKWLKQQLSNKGIISSQHVFFATINQNHDLHISLKNDLKVQIPPIFH